MCTNDDGDRKTRYVTAGIDRLQREREGGPDTRWNRNAIFGCGRSQWNDANNFSRWLFAHVICSTPQMLFGTNSMAHYLSKSMNANGLIMAHHKWWAEIYRLIACNFICHQANLFYMVQVQVFHFQEAFSFNFVFFISLGVDFKRQFQCVDSQVVNCIFSGN